MTPEIMMCAVCKRTLDMRADETGVSFVHTFSDLAEDFTHQPVPVKADEQWRQRCDFCANGAPKFLVPARDFRVPGNALQDSLGDWSACEWCALLIGADRWPNLVRRVQAMHKHRFGQPMPVEAREALWRLFAALSENITGPIRPIEGGGDE